MNRVLIPRMYFPKKEQKIFRKKVFSPHKRKPLKIAASYSTELMMNVQLYDMSATDVFVSSAIHNLLVFHIPCVFLYRTVFALPWGYTANLILALSVIKTMIQLNV